ncbi:MAG: hypothetical protein WEA09_05860 [Gemmatimonadota bacterium]
MFNGRMTGSSILMVAATAAAMAIPGVTAPTEVQAQEQAQVQAQAAEGAVDPMEVVARMYLEIAEIRDELHQQLAGVHDAFQRDEVRTEINEQLAAVYERHGVSAADYDAFIAWLSSEAEEREAFQAILERLQDGDGD